MIIELGNRKDITEEEYKAIKQTIKAESKEEAINYANSLIDLNGGVSFNTGKINYKIKEVSDDND